MNPYVIGNHSSNHLISENTPHPLTPKYIKASSILMSPSKTSWIIPIHIDLFLQRLYLYLYQSSTCNHNHLVAISKLLQLHISIIILRLQIQWSQEHILIFFCTPHCNKYLQNWSEVNLKIKWIRHSKFELARFWYSRLYHFICNVKNLLRITYS